MTQSATNDWKQWRFDALDTLFFRESRPLEAVGGVQLSSVFPPPVRTLIGALRTSVGEAWRDADGRSVDWKDYGARDKHPLREVMGDAHGFGPLKFAGPDLLLVDAAAGVTAQRLYPAPLWWMRGGETNAAVFAPLRPSDQPVQCDLGRVRLPVKSGALADPRQGGAKPLENTFVTAQVLAAMLKGQAPTLGDLYAAGELFDTEDRLGIGRNSQRGTVIDGLLYQTRHVRLRQRIKDQRLVLGLRVTGLPDWMPQQGMVRLGGEGRLAAWTAHAATAPLPPPSQGAKNVILMLLSAAQFERGWLPDGFQPAHETDAQGQPQDVWVGEIDGVKLRLVCAVTGKAQREGGWDLANHAPRAMSSLVPAGSAYFCEVLEGDAATLHGRFIGQDTVLGRGELAVGVWS